MTKEEAIEAVKEAYGNSEYTDEIIKALEQEPTWIPANERSPEKSDNYWCTFGGTNLTGIDYYTTSGDAKETYEEPEEYVGWQSHNVIAWMPLPEPYKTEGSEKE